MKKAYQKPCAKRVNFSYEKVIAASQACGSGIVYTHDDPDSCESMTPDKETGRNTAMLAWSIDPTICGRQYGPNR